MAVSLLICEWSPHKELLVEQVERLSGLIHRERIQVNFSWIPSSHNAIIDHFMHPICAVRENLVIWARKEEKATSAMVHVVSAVEVC